MGVKGLLPDLRSITERVHLSRFRGQVAAVDALCWLHRGGVSCAKDLVEETSSTNGHITFCASMLDMLIENSIKPVLVFDGRPLLAKGGCNNDRKALREKNKEAARLAELNGDSALAFSLYKRAISVNSTMILQLIQMLKSRGIDFLVAPYEADAQLAFLSREGLVDLVISEDSDCLVFGCRRVLFKLDREGNGELICRSDLGTNQQLNFAGWKDDQFRLFCCLAGCDYTSKIRGLGIKKAHKIVAEHRTFGAVITVLRGTYHIDDDAAIEVSYF